MTTGDGSTRCQMEIPAVGLSTNFTMAYIFLFDLCLDWNGVQSRMGLEWNGIQSWLVGVDSTQMYQHLFDEHGASPIHFEFEHFVLGAL